MSTEQNGSKAGTPSPERLGSAVCCPVCGKMPTLQNEYQFCDMRLYHCCRHQPTNYLFMVEFKAVLFTSGAITENELVEKLVNSWNAYCAQNALAQGRAACGESLGAGGSAANDKEKANA